jgi:tetratricopeptide (TPR) repeat protein/ADP-heptose:LPS heptosyltransferase
MSVYRPEQSMNSRILLQDGLQRHQQGLLAEAERLYRAALEREPKNFDALRLLAMALMQQGRLDDAAQFAAKAVKHNPVSYDALTLHGSILLKLRRIGDAVSCFDRAVAAHPGSADARYNRAVALSEAGLLPQALAAFDEVVAARPSDVSALIYRGTVLARLGKPEGAIANFDRVLTLAPNHPDALINRGNALAMLGHHSQALECFDRVLSIQPNRTDALSNRAIALNALNRAEEALASCEKALSLDADCVDALVAQGNIFYALERHEEALASYDRALALKPATLGIVVNRGLSLIEFGRFDEALAEAQQAVAANPRDARAYLARGRVLHALARYQDAIADYETALELEPGVADAKFNLAVCQLWLGHLEDGWSKHERRSAQKYPQRQWNGERIAGSLLIWADEGIGDQIIYSGAIADLESRADRIVLEVDRRLVPLFSRSFPSVNVVPLADKPYAGTIDAQGATADLARHLRRSWDSFPRPQPAFLKPDPARVRELRGRLHRDRRPVIGLSWISKSTRAGQFKSARLADFEPLLRLPGYRFLDLQYGDTAAERQTIARDLQVEVERVDEIDNTNDLDGLAALLCACDAVLTVSNTTAHLAGAVGAPTFVMVPFGRGHIWYWFADRLASPWYPDLQVRRRHQNQAWSALVAEIVPDLVSAAASPRGQPAVHGAADARPPG